VIDRDRYKAEHSEADIREVKRNSFLSNAPGLALTYRRLFPEAQLHIRSNLGEIGRSVYRRNRKPSGHLDASEMATVWKRMGDHPSSVAAFEDFIAASRFDRIYDYDPLDMFYWENRMGTWHSLAMNETDVAFPTLSCFNSRQVIDLLLSAPVADRVSGETYRGIIAASWPELLDWPINQPLGRRLRSA
jgi:hypothetical protein